MNKRNFSRRVAAALALGIGLGSVAQAQTVLRTHFGPKANDRFGLSVSGVGDVNNDGHPDYIVGAPEDAAVFSVAEGFAQVFSGLNGSVIYTIDGLVIGEGVGTAVSGVGDVNMDGVADFAVGVPLSGQGGEVRVFSGANGSLLWGRLGLETGALFGAFLSPAGDTNGDGFADVLVGAPEAGGANNNGAAFILSGVNGSTLQTFNGNANDRMGISLDTLGDVNGDTFADVIVGSDLGGARVFSGFNGALLYTLTAPFADHLGASVAGIDDITGDGIGDVLVGAPEDNDFFFFGEGYVEVRSGATGAIVTTLNGPQVGDLFGESVGDAGDFNADGTPDILVGATQSGNGFQGFVKIFSGADFTELATVTGLVNHDHFGHAVAGVGDLDGDGSTEILVGAPRHDPFGMNAAGMIRIYSGEQGTAPCGTPTNYCGTTPNSAGSGAVMSFTGSTSIAANDLTLVANNCPPNSQGIFVQGDGNSTSSIGDGTLCVGGGNYVLRILPGLNTGPAGVATRLIDYNSPITPETVITAGSTWNFQFWYRDPFFGSFGYNLSDALSITFCP